MNIIIPETKQKRVACSFVGRLVQGGEEPALLSVGDDTAVIPARAQLPTGLRAYWAQARPSRFRKFWGLRAGKVGSV